MLSCDYHDLCFMALVTALVTALAAVPILILLTKRHRQTVEKHACVLVLGDIGRSPRMQYHSRSLSKHGYSVDIIGFGGSLPHQAIMNDDKISLIHLNEFSFKALPAVMRYPLKVVLLTLSLLHALLIQTQKHSLIILQNPPSIPTMFVAWLVSCVENSTFIIDWHNYGYTVLSLTLGHGHVLVKFAERFERYFGQLSSHNICVTEAMRRDLAENWMISATTMYDKPPALFEPSGVEKQHELFSRLSKEYREFGVRQFDHGNVPEGMEDAVRIDASCLTMISDIGTVQHRSNRPALLVSSTSWTEDEDFSILLSALEMYDENLSSSKFNDTFPDIVCAITGKGPLKDYYKSLIASKKFKHVRICTPWLLAEDYPTLLGSADLGVCLHKSTSGFDLPMKVVDMFGCGLPVCAVGFNCISELVIDGTNGLIFWDDKQLFEQLQELLTGFPNPYKLKKLRGNLTNIARWDETWDRVVLPIIS